MRLLVLIGGVLLAVLIGFSAIHMWGNSQVYKPYNTSYFKNDKIIWIVPWEQNFLIEKNPNIVLWADVYRNKNGEILVKPWVERNTAKKDLAQESSPTRPLLSDLLRKFANSNWVVNCNDNTHDIHTTLTAVLKESGIENQILVQSNYNTILESLKQNLPMLVYGSTIADITRLKTFQSLGLLTAAPFKGDVFFTPLFYLQRPTVNEGIVLEMKRRFKKIILGPINSREEFDTAQSLNPDGIFVSDPFLLSL